MAPKKDSDHSPEQKFAQEMMRSYGSSSVRLQMVIHDKNDDEESFTGTGFIVFADQDLCLIMSCGHNFDGYRVHSNKDAIYVEFAANNKLKADLVFCDVKKEVSMIRIGRNQINRPAITWSAAEAPLHELVAILSYMNDPEGNPIHRPSVYSGTVIRREAMITFGGIAVEHNVTADYACVQGNSGSPVVNRNGMVGIHMGGTATTAYFISLSGVKIVLKEQLAKIGLNNVDDILDMIGRIAQMEKVKLTSTSKQPSGGGKGTCP